MGSLFSASEVVSDLTSPPAFTVWNLIQFGILGIGFGCLAIRKYIVPEWVLKQAEERHAASERELREVNAKLQGQVEKLQTVFQDQMLPALIRSTEVAATYNEELARRRWAQSPDTKL